MSKLRTCGLCCTVLSLWAIIQLVIMGFCFYYETYTFLEEAMEYAHQEQVTDIDKFVKTTKESYRKIAVNCWLAAGMYVGTLCLSLICICIAKTRSKTVISGRDEDLLCSTEAEKFTTFDKEDKEKQKEKKYKPINYVKQHKLEKKALLKKEKSERKEILLKLKQEQKEKQEEEKREAKEKK